MEIDHLTKNELNELLVVLERKLLALDETSLYSLKYYFNYYFNNQDETRSQLLSQINTIKSEILFREDDEKRAKYEAERRRDPLKYGKGKRPRI